MKCTRMKFVEILSSISCVPFYLLAFAAIICSLGMIFLGNIVRGGFLLVGAFTAIAGLYFMLSANFVAISQILIYSVGITLVVVFAIMLTSLKVSADTNIDECEAEDSFRIPRAFAAISSLILFLLLTYVINSQDWTKIADVTGASSLRDVSGISASYTPLIGKLMMQEYLIPFELISVLLLIIFVGAVILSKKSLEE